MPIQPSKIKQAILVSKNNLDPHSAIENIALFDTNGTTIDLTPKTGSNLIFSPYVTNTADSIGTKTISSPEPVSGTIVFIKFTNGNDVQHILFSFNGNTAKPVMLGGKLVDHSQIKILANAVVAFFFDGTVFHQLGSMA